jgi:hypothetical protein
VSRAAELGALCWSKEQGTHMNMKMVTFTGAFALVGCGGLQEAPDVGGGNPFANVPAGASQYGPAAGTSSYGGYGTAGTGYESAGYGTAGTVYESGGYGTAGTGYESGGYGTGGTGYESGGYGTAGTGYESGGYEAGGYGTAGSGYGGASPVGGSSQGGAGPVPPDEWTCLQNVSHCFNAAANCYEYSPWSDCDQIVDVCAAMQETCDSLP